MLAIQIYDDICSGQVVAGMSSIHRPPSGGACICYSFVSHSPLRPRTSGSVCRTTAWNRYVFTVLTPASLTAAYHCDDGCRPSAHVFIGVLRSSFGLDDSNIFPCPPTPAVVWPWRGEQGPQNHRLQSVSRVPALAVCPPFAAYMKTIVGTRRHADRPAAESSTRVRAQRVVKTRCAHVPR